MVRARLLIYGAGGHGCVVLDAARASGAYELAGLLDDDPARLGHTVHGLRVLGGRSCLQLPEMSGHVLVLGVGDNSKRRSLAHALASLSPTYATVVHPAAVVGSGADLGEGSVLLPMSVVHTEASLGEHVIVNTGATVDHHATLGDFVHVAPGAHIGGGVRIGPGSLIGIGASVVPEVSIGTGAIIGAGAAVIGDVPDGAVVGGVPAHVLEREGAE